MSMNIQTTSMQKSGYYLINPFNASVLKLEDKKFINYARIKKILKCEYAGRMEIDIAGTPCLAYYGDEMNLHPLCEYYCVFKKHAECPNVEFMAPYPIPGPVLITSMKYGLPAQVSKEELVNDVQFMDGPAAKDYLKKIRKEWNESGGSSYSIDVCAADYMFE